MVNFWIRRAGIIGVLTAALIGAAPTASAAPTYEDADDFAAEVYDRGILEDVPKAQLAQLLANICYQSDYPANALAAMYADGYGLSGKDAQWMVNAALDRCN